MKLLQTKKMKWILYGVFFVLFTVFIVCISYLLAYSHTIIPGISVQGIPLGNKTIEEATKLFEQQRTLDTLASLEFTGDEKTATYSIEQLQFSLSPSKTAQQAYQIGRGTDMT